MLISRLLAFLGALLLVILWAKAPAMADDEKASGLEKATLACGCFWGVQDKFDHVKGVVSTTVGYTGGSAKRPSYPDVCSGTTGHCEAVEIIFDPAKVSYGELLDVFWRMHDPTDATGRFFHGGQYRSAIFYHDAKQKEIALQSKQKLEKRLSKSVHTDIDNASVFWRAEEYHQHYDKKHGGGSCHI